MIIGRDYYYYGAYLEKNGLNKQHILDKEKGNPASLKGGHELSSFGSVNLNISVVSPTDVYEPSNLLPFTPDTEDTLFQPYTSGYDIVKQKFGESDPFRVNGYQQWHVFSKNLYDSGFFEGKSDEEIQEIDTLLRQLTSGLDSFNLRVHMKDYAISATLSQTINEMIPGYYDAHFGIDAESAYYMTKEDWEIELESSSRALQYFCNKFVPEDHQNEFRGLIEQFYAFNAQSLENYQSPYEKIGIPYLAAMAEGQRQKSEQMEGENVSEQIVTPQPPKNTSTYMDTIRAFFSQLASASGNERQYLLNHFLADVDNKKSEHIQGLLNDRRKDPWVKMFELEEKLNNESGNRAPAQSE